MKARHRRFQRAQVRARRRPKPPSRGFYVSWDQHDRPHLVFPNQLVILDGVTAYA